MANCPNCGSAHIYAKSEENVNLRYTAATWTFFGDVITERKDVSACFDCGTSWRAAELYYILQNIQILTGVVLDLAEVEARQYMNSFISEVGPDIALISDIEKRTKQLIAEKKQSLSQSTAAGCCGGCLVSIMGCTAIISLGSAISGSGILLLLMLFLPPVFFVGLGMFLDSGNRKSIELEIEEVKKEANKTRDEAEERLQIKVRQFMENHSL